jgi:putative heme-binding domain-containing protein
METVRWSIQAVVAAVVVIPVIGLVALRGQQPAQAPVAGDYDRGTAQFAQICSACHGPAGIGGDRGPALVNNRTLRARSADEIQLIIRNGTSAGMPGFTSMAESDLQSVATFVRSLNSSAFDIQPTGDSPAGERFFFGKGQCNSCHMALGRGKPVGPDLSNIGRQLTLSELTQALTDPEATIAPGYELVRVRLGDGKILEGFARNEGNDALPLVTLDGELHSLNESQVTKLPPTKKSIMPALSATPQEQKDLIAYLARLNGGTPVPATDSAAAAADFDQILHPKAGDWPTYHGRLDGNRYSTLAQITAANAHNLSLQWIYPLRDANNEMTPVVKDGVMYITGPNRANSTAQVSALDARTGREIWRYTRPKTQNLQGDTASGLNRGVALLGDRVFATTDNAVLICLNRLTGALMWQTDMIRAENAGPENGGTSAPLVIRNMVIAGVSGGDVAGLRGFIAAHDAVTGKELWRFWTVPRPGEPGSETWKGTALARGGGGATWLPGTYDEATGTLYWTAGNPYPDSDGSERVGDNLYTDCILALDANTGKLKWY